MLPPAAAATAAAPGIDATTSPNSSSSGGGDIVFLYIHKVDPEGEDPPMLVPPSLAHPLVISSATCSPAVGLYIQIQGLNPTTATTQGLAEAPDATTAEVIAVFTRYLPDTTCEAAPQAPTSSSSSNGGLGVNPMDVGLTQPCGGATAATYSDSIKLDSAIAYVLQRRQWQAKKRGQIRPGSLLDRPSLLVNPKRVKSAASKVSVIKGGDGGKFAMKKRMAGRPPGAAARYVNTLGAAPQQAEMLQQQVFEGGGGGGGYGAAQYAPAFGAAPAACMAFGGYGGGMGHDWGAPRLLVGEQVEVAGTPSLSYCPPAVVVTGLHPVTGSGEVQVTPEKLRELMGGVTLEVRHIGGFRA